MNHIWLALSYHKHLTSGNGNPNEPLPGLRKESSKCNEIRLPGARVVTLHQSAEVFHNSQTLSALIFNVLYKNGSEDEELGAGFNTESQI